MLASYTVVENVNESTLIEATINTMSRDIKATLVFQTKCHRAQTSIDISNVFTTFIMYDNLKYIREACDEESCLVMLFDDDTLLAIKATIDKMRVQYVKIHQATK